MRRVALVLVSIASFLSCKHGEPAPSPAVAAPSPNEAPAPPPEPKIELVAAPALPASPAGLPAVADSADNPTSPEKADLGHLLFFDKRLSKDGSMACAQCHHPDMAWTDGAPVSAKVGGAMNKRNAPTMENLAYHTSFYWDGRKPTLEAVSQAAWTGQLGADPKAVAAAVDAVPKYHALFMRAFSEGATADNIPKAYAAFLRTLKSGNSPWDKFEAGDKTAAPANAQKGFEVFKNAGCALCHVPPLYSDADFHNVGVGSDAPADKRDHGRTDASKDPKDEGKFKTPTLRDVAKTAPYFHDGSVASLDGAIDFMLGGGKKNPNLDAKLKPHKLSKKDRAALKAFIESLSGESTVSAAVPELP